MNIFWLDSDPQKCAQYHNNKHVVKMILELAQLLSTAHRVLDGDEYADSQNLYKKTHMNHPCAIWVRENSANYIETVVLLSSLLEEYTYRYEKQHKVESIFEALTEPPQNIKISETMSKIPLAMPDECKSDNDAILSYRTYYKTHKRNMANWKNREQPEWWE